MATYQNTTSLPFGANLFAAATNILENLAASLTAWNQARVTKAELSNLSARELADIGLTRGDINNI
jgi:uncharacterized protein YjiS (DUF1127 family)